MIDQEQLSAALKRLDPRDWEVLDLSLRRRVPDEALARIFEVEPQDVARRRASAVENLAEELGVQRGEDLGNVLKALLETDTWDSAESESWKAFAEQAAGPSSDGEEGEPAREEEQRPGRRAERAEGEPGDGGEPGEEEEPGEGAPGDEEGDAEEAPGEQEPARAARTSETSRLFRLTPAPPPPEEEESPLPTPSPTPAPETAEEPRTPPLAPPQPPRKPTPVVAPVNGTLPPPSEPVLEMLAEREDDDRRGRIRTPLLWALAGGLGAAGLFGAGYVGATQFGDEESSSKGPGSDTRHFVPASGGPIAAPFPSDPGTTSCYSITYLRRPATLYRRPGGKAMLELPARTEWRSPRVLSVVRKRGDWLAVLAPELANGEWGWMKASEATSIDCVRWSLHVDLSRRRLFVRRDGHTMRSYSIAIGERRHPTPQGRFAVTDKLRVTDQGSPYGCCVLALTGHQTQLPPDWPGGDRLAVHATSDLGSIGKRTSLGCMRVTPPQAGWLIRTVPLGSPVFIRR